jgi:hypothetical protein
MMKLRVPRGCGSVSYNGQLLSIDSDGLIDVDELGAGILAAHGLVPVHVSETAKRLSGADVDDVARLDRSGLFSLLRSRRVSVSLPITNEGLRAAARRALAG